MMTFDEFKIGTRFEFDTHVSTSDVEAFAKVSGDFNPIHLDEEFAKQTIFKDRIIHGMTVGALFSRTMASDFPGPGSVYLNQTLNFKRPIYHNSDLKIIIEVAELKPAKKIVLLNTTCLVNGKLCVDGQATIKLLDYAK